MNVSCICNNDQTSSSASWRMGSRPAVEDAGQADETLMQ